MLPTQETLQQDNYPTLEGTKARYTELQAQFETQPVQEGRMAVICPVYDADDLIVPTVTELVDHLEGSQLTGADVIIVLNSGGGSTYKARSALESIGVPVYYPRPESQFHEQVSGTRLIIVDQPGRQGKYYALDYIYERIALDPTYNPEWTMLIDAETRLYSKHPENPAIDSLIRNAVAIDGLVGGESLIVYFVDGLPLLNVRVDNPIIRYINHRSRIIGAPYLDGGCIVGKTSKLIPLSKTGLELIPGNPADDHMLSIMCGNLGIPFSTDHSVMFTNRTPLDEDARDRQLTRWKRAPQMVRERLGRDFYTPLSIEEKAKRLFRIKFKDLNELTTFLRLYTGYSLAIKRILRNKDNTFQLTAAWNHSPSSVETV